MASNTDFLFLRVNIGFQRQMIMKIESGMGNSAALLISPQTGSTGGLLSDFISPLFSDFSSDRNITR